MQWIGIIFWNNHSNCDKSNNFRPEKKVYQNLWWAKVTARLNPRWLPTTQERSWSKIIVSRLALESSAMPLSMSFCKENSAYMLFLWSRSNIKVTARSNQIWPALAYVIIIKMIICNFLSSIIRCNTVHLFHFVSILVFFNKWPWERQFWIWPLRDVSPP